LTFSPRIFFDHVRQGILGPTLDAQEVSGCDAILAAMAGAPLSHVAYALATAYHETASTMQPIKEFGGDAYFRRKYDPLGVNPALAKQLGNTFPGDGIKYAGRGYVQLTGRANYARAGLKLSLPLTDNPDRALEPDTAARIMRRGMAEGWFTGKSFASYLPATGPADRTAFTSARRIINGTDKAALIAGYALQFQTALKAGGWP
jgi:putative chitinase